MKSRTKFVTLVFVIICICAIVVVIAFMKVQSGIEVTKLQRGVQGSPNIAIESGEGTQELALLGESGERVRRLSPQGEFVVDFKLSPNRDVVAFVTQSTDIEDVVPKFTLWVSDMEFGQPRVVGEFAAMGCKFAIAPDSKSIAVFTEADLSVLNTSADGLRQIHTFPPSLLTSDSDNFYVPEPFWVSESALRFQTHAEDYLQTGKVATYQIDINTRKLETVTVGTDNYL